MDLIKANEILKVINELDSNSKKSIIEALNLAEHVERTSGDFYAKEVEKNKGNELESFFSFMVKEEEMHLNKILELKQKLNTDEEIEKISFPTHEMPKIKSIPAGKDEMTSLLYALWREKKAEDFYRKASEKTKGQVSLFFLELADFEKKHVELFEEYIENMGNVNELIMG
ncbi:MAG: ferritin family protein [Candidatus ainarchaeum sp.]|nr:ferritin family protein [Candidatus ainarchaeum sp.]